ncbi:MFS transporter [Streptomyces atratus]|uniref:MFS transporter n=1 Tax=Streptomyces atratus TaxID=1893 RepID=UPI00340112EC
MTFSRALARSATAWTAWTARITALNAWSGSASSPELGLVTIPAGLAHDWPWLCVAVVGTGFLTAPTLSAVADAVSRLAPASVRGEATGLQSSAQSAGFALGSPIVGVAIDLSVPAGGFAAAGLAGLAAALTGCLLSRRCPAPRNAASGRLLILIIRGQSYLGRPGGIEGDSRGSGHVQGVDTGIHRDAYMLVGSQ